METYPNPNPPAARDVIGALPADARAADASGGGLLPLLLMLTLLMTGCLVVPIPVNRPVPGARTNITPQTMNQLGTGEVSRAEVLLQLGEPDEMLLEGRQFRYHTERVKWDVYWVLSGEYSANYGIIEVKKLYDLVLRFDDLGKLVEGAWLDGWFPGKLHEKARWTPEWSGELQEECRHEPPES